ncbi:MAG: efflux RND transporter periplasmic adaptor subunit [Planctomycetota bacterium]|nr:efflux RND transporter periplasmic adaptor subunit [Planctomycetota bacterium]
MSLRNGVRKSTPTALLRKEAMKETAMGQTAPSKQPRRTYGGFVLVGVLTLLAGGTMAALLHGRQAPAALEPAAVQASEFVAAPGLVESAGGLRDMAFQVAGQIRAVFVEEGQRVAKGQILAELDSDEMSASLNAARAEAASAEARMKVLEGEIASEIARAQYEVDRLKAELTRLKAGPRPEELERARAETRASEIEWRRRADDAQRYKSHPTVSSEQERVMTSGQAEIARAQYEAQAARQRELETGTRAEDLEKAAAMLKAAEADWTRAKETREARLSAARGQVEQAQARTRAAEATLRKTQLIAPIDGVVVWKFRNPGETVGVLPLERVLTVADLSALRVRADVDEADFARIHPGQKVRVTAEAYGARSFAGHVERVSCAAGEKRFSTGEARERQDVKVVETVVVFDETPPLKLNLRVTVQFLLD